MTTEPILWAALAGLAGWNLKMQWWILAHHKSCHTQPAADHAALQQRVASCEDECGRLAKNAHDDRNRLSQVSLWNEVLKERAGIK